ASPGVPINITVQGKGGEKGEKGEKGDTGTKGDKGIPCQCSLQNPKKPSAHIESVNKGTVWYPANTVIKDWSVSAPYSYLAGGMTYQDGKLKVPTPGRYYIYAQIYYHNSVRVFVEVNNKRITMMQPPTSGQEAGSLYTGGVFNLETGDVIALTSYNYPHRNGAKIYMDTHHSYFGAFLI
ncbi:unnamed protein product, partial [Porites lobata]